jgi:hypothetical protein
LLDVFKNKIELESLSKDYIVLVELSPVTYLALCGLVSDAMQHPSDATPILARVAKELSSATAGGMIPSELVEQPEYMENLRRAGYASR